MRYQPDSEPLDQFIRRKGGINACAALSRVPAIRGVRASPDEGLGKAEVA
jgi:hypothetical protein